MFAAVFERQAFEAADINGQRLLVVGGAGGPGLHLGGAGSSGLVRLSSVESAARDGGDSGTDTPDDDMQLTSTLAIDDDDDESVDPDQQYADEPGSSSAVRLHHLSRGPNSRMSRRAIANSNERRRMRSINAGFQQLKELVRPGGEEKLSKAAILQLAVDCIMKLTRDKRRLADENDNLLRILSGRACVPPRLAQQPPYKRSRLDDDTPPGSSSSSSSSSSISSDEGVAEMSGDRRPPTMKVSAVRAPRPTVDDAPARRRQPVAAEAASLQQQQQHQLVLQHRSSGSGLPTLLKQMDGCGGVGGLDVVAVQKQEFMDQPSKPEVIVRGAAVPTMSVFDRLVMAAAVSGSDAVVPNVSAAAAAAAAAAPTAADVAPVSKAVKVEYSRCLSSDRFGSQCALQPDELANGQGSKVVIGEQPAVSSMSQRNLDTIIQAIRYLEGGDSKPNHQVVVLRPSSSVKTDAAAVVDDKTGIRWMSTMLPVNELQRQVQC